MVEPRRIAIVGGGMAGLATAWRLSEPGWEERFESITVYQRGHRLGGKGASSRSVNGRIEEHGLHIWLGYYENAFRLLRECYDELDRPATDPDAAILTWRDALKPSVDVGLQDDQDGEWTSWVGDFSTNDLVPGEPAPTARQMSVQEFVRRAFQLLVDYESSLDDFETTPHVELTTSAVPSAADEPSRAARIALGGLIEAMRLAESVSGALGLTLAVPQLDAALDAIRSALVSSMDDQPKSQRSWHLVSIVVATIRGIVADGLLVDPGGWNAINDEDYRAWILRHGCAPDAARSTLIRGLYDLVFAHAEGNPDKPGFGAGLGVFLSAKTFFDYKGAIFWKMQAGMGDVVFAPLYQVLRARGVRIEFFNRLDALHVSADDTRIESMTMGRQVALTGGREAYEPLTRVRDLPCFPKEPLIDQLATTDSVLDHDLESHWCRWPDTETRTLQRGRDFDEVVLAVPTGMAHFVCTELIERRRAWRDMVDNLGTVATAAFQIWVRETEPDLGWPIPGVTMSGYVKPYDTWASMPQLIEAEDWPADDKPGTIAYFCSVIPTDPVEKTGDDDYPVVRRDEARSAAVDFLDQHLGRLWPGAVDERGFRWDLLCGAGGAAGSDRFDSQFWVANVDPSDRYVQSLPGTDRYRLRADESGYENLFLAGDWTNCGLNAGCIESAVMSGLQAANALLGRSLDDAVAGAYMDDWTTTRSG